MRCSNDCPDSQRQPAFRKSELNPLQHPARFRLLAPRARSTGKVFVDLTRTWSRGDIATRERPRYRCGLRTVAFANERRARNRKFVNRGKFLRIRPSWRLVRLCPASRANEKESGTNTTGSVSSGSRINGQKSTWSCWRDTSTIRNATKSSPEKWVGRRFWATAIGARRSMHFWTKIGVYKMTRLQAAPNKSRVKALKTTFSIGQPSP